MSDMKNDIHLNYGPNIEEAYRVLKTNLQYYGIDRKIQKIVVTSSGHGDGKTSTAINLCISFAQSGSKVLLIDADLHKPMLLKHLGSNNFLGITNYVSGNATIEEIINSSSLENFYYITCGPKPVKSADILSSKKFAELLEHVESSFDLIVIDSPSLGTHIDAAILASQADGVLIVIRSKYTDYRNVITAREQLEKVGAKIIGIVLNRMDKKYYKLYTNHYIDHGTHKKFSNGWFNKFESKGEHL
jgi:protein-tyrosine kinase